MHACHVLSVFVCNHLSKKVIRPQLLVLYNPLVLFFQGTTVSRVGEGLRDGPRPALE